MNDAGDITHANSRAERLLGYGRGELSGRSRDTILVQEPRLPERERKEAVRPTSVCRKDGSLVPVEMCVSYIAADNGGSVLISLTDLSERRRGEQALCESEERFRNMANAAPAMIWVTGPDRMRTFVNQGWLAFTGRTADEELGEGWAEGIHPDDREAYLTAYERSFAAGVPFQLEYRLRRADGEYRFVRDAGAPRGAPGGALTGYVGCSVEINDLKRIQEGAVWRQRLESLGILTGGIAHDFNNLLGSIVADSELALAEIEEKVACDAEVRRIRTVAIRASEIVRELMIYAGQDNASLEPVDITVLVEEMVHLLRVSIPKHAVLTSQLAPALPAVLAKSSQLRQVVMNLMINAAEALGPKGGTITVTTSCLSLPDGDGDAGRSLIPPGEYVSLQVSDTGRGMSEDVQARIYDPFFSTKASGRGLGLAVVRGIVNAYGGHIRLHSVLGEGTRFEVLFPYAPKAVIQKGAAPDPEIRPVAPAIAANLLMVEDEEGLRQAMGKMLMHKGIGVTEAQDGWAALEAIRDPGIPIDLILLDMTIPGATSQEVFVEAQKLRPNCRVVLTTAYSREEAGARFAGPQVKGFLRKPYQFAELERVIREALA
jgi:PAS domain S-box-containing protein